MANAYWKTGNQLFRRKEVKWPSFDQALLQLLIAAVIGLVWGGLLIGFLWLTDPRPPAQASAPAEAVAAVVESTPTATPTSPPPTNTPTPLPTKTPTATPEVTLEESSVTAPAEPAVVEPSPTVTETPLPTPSPTATPLPPTDTPEPVEPAAQVSFSQDVFPILERRCLKCHGGPQDDGSLRMEEGLDMRTYASLLEGSWNGPVIEPGNADGSFLIEMITKGKMPKNGPRLLPGEIQTITDWIQAGAPDN